MSRAKGNPEWGMPVSVGEQTSTPFWPDACGHGGYLGSVSWYERDNSERKIDVYLFEDSDRQQVCIRYGEQGHEYISPGTPCNVMLTAFRHGRALPEYPEAFQILMDHGNFVWMKKEK